jgi:hypothetical protein
MMIDVAEQFSAHPSGREPKDGPFNGEKFRRELLIPAIKKIMEKEVPDKHLVVNIDSVRTFGSSFLEEAFGGLYRETGFDASMADTIVQIKCSRPRLQMFRDSILQHMKDAKIEAQAS